MPMAMPMPGIAYAYGSSSTMAAQREDICFRKRGRKLNSHRNQERTKFRAFAVATGALFDLLGWFGLVFPCL